MSTQPLGPAPVPSELADAAGAFTIRPQRWRIAGPTTEEMTYQFGTVAVGSWLVWPDGVEPDLNAMGVVQVYNEDPRANYVSSDD